MMNKLRLLLAVLLLHCAPGFAADSKISDLTAITGANVDAANDLLPIVDLSATATKKISIAELFKTSGLALNPGASAGSLNNIIIGAITPLAASFTTGSFTGQVTSTLATGTAPFVVASTTNVANLNASSLNGATFAAPGAIGTGTPGTAAFTTVAGTTATFSSLTSGRCHFGGTAGLITDSANCLYSDTGLNSGPGITIGSGTTTSVGWKWGYSGSSGYSALYTNSVTPGATNYILQAGVPGDVYLNAIANNINFRVSNTQIAQITSTALLGASDGAQTLGTSSVGWKQYFGNTGTITTQIPVQTNNCTWNASGVTFTCKLNTVTSTASAAGSLVEDWQVGGASIFSLGKAGGLNLAASAVILGNTDIRFQVGAAGIGYRIALEQQGTATNLVGYGAGTASWYADYAGISITNGKPFGYRTVASSNAWDSTLNSFVANSFTFGGATNNAAGAATSRTEFNKAIASVANNTATTLFTVSIPNAAHYASIRVTVTCSLGAGGAIGAGESTQEATYNIAIARVAGVNAVATIGAVIGQEAAASVAGAANVATTATLGAISGAVGATNTFTIQATAARSGGSSDNHNCLGHARLMNANATGITIS